VFADYAELKKNMDGSDDLTFDRVFDTLIKDVRSRGMAIETPTDPLNDPAFIGALNSAYDYGGPAQYPAEAPRGEPLPQAQELTGSPSLANDFRPASRWTEFFGRRAEGIAGGRGGEIRGADSCCALAPG